jgi:hypothetical protein
MPQRGGSLPELWIKNDCRKLSLRTFALMHGVDEIIDEASLLPADARAKIVDSLLQTLNAPATSENECLQLAKKRLAALRSGKVQPVSGTEVFQKIRNRFET